MRPFSIRIFVPSGDPDGVLVASRDDWPGRAVIFSRDLLGEVKGRKEFALPGVYLLVGGNKLYIGEGDPVGGRLESHAREKGFWTRAVFFTSEGRLNKAHIQHLESRMVDLAKDAGRAELENGNIPQPPSLSEEEHAYVENFLAELLVTLPLLGFSQLEPSEEDASEGETAAEPATVSEPAVSGRRAALYSSLPRGMMFQLHYANVTATLELVEGGVEVKAGSGAVKEPKAHFEVHAQSYAAMRRQLLESRVMTEQNGRLSFTRDQFFSSASAAAAVIRGQNSNADCWVASDGTNLGDLLRKARGR